MTDKEISDLRRILEKELEVIEQRIYDVEKIYLEESSTFGNIIKGWESGLNFKNHKHHMLNAPKKFKISEKDRLFSLSSCTSPANRALRRELEHTENQSLITPAQTNSFLKKRKIKKNKFLHPPNQRTGAHRNPKDSDDEEELPSPSESNGKTDQVKLRTKTLKESGIANHGAVSKNWIKSSKASTTLKVKKTKKSS